MALGVHPLLVMAAATPIPVQLSEWLFAGLYAGAGVHLARCKTVDLEVPSHSEIVLEGTIIISNSKKWQQFATVRVSSCRVLYNKYI